MCTSKKGEKGVPKGETSDISDVRIFTIMDMTFKERKIVKEKKDYSILEIKISF
jgi:hypothetical protein